MMRLTLSIICSFIWLIVSYGQPSRDFLNIQADNKNIFDFAFSSKGNLVAITQESSVMIYDSYSGKYIDKLISPDSNELRSIFFSNDSTKLVTGDVSGTVQVWDLNTKKILQSIRLHQGPILDLLLAYNNDVIVSASADNTIKVFNLKSNELIYDLDRHLDDVLSIDFDAKREILASASADKTIKLWDCKNGRIISSIEQFQVWHRQVKFSINANQLIVCSDNSKIRILNTANLRNVTLQNTLKESQGWLTSLDIYKDGSSMIAGGINGELTILSNNYLYKYNLEVPITKVAFMPTNSPYFLIAASTLGKGLFILSADQMNLTKK